MSAQTFTITQTDVRPERDWETANGQFRSYFVRAEGDDRTFEVSRKRTSPAPQIGEQLLATVEEREHNGTTYYKLKKVPQQGSFGGGGKDYKADPAKLRGEAMRSAIHAASGYVTAMAAVDRIPASFFESFDNYKSLDPMIRHWYGLILEAQAGQS